MLTEISAATNLSSGEIWGQTEAGFLKKGRTIRNKIRLELPTVPVPAQDQVT